MVNARLHMICGNCGCNDQWENSVYIADGEGEKLHVDMHVSCKNCATLHTLELHELIDDRELKEEDKGAQG